LHRFSNGFRMEVVALVGLHIQFHLLSRHQTYLMPLRSQRPPQERRSTAGFHADHLHLQGRGKSQRLRARTSFPCHHLPTGIQAQKDDFPC
jgi:hypothetical protein